MTGKNTLDNRYVATPIVICTIISKNYLSAARTLMESIRAYHPDIELVTLLVDTIDGKFDPKQECFTTLLASDLGIPRWEHFSMKYDILELNTAVKPYLLEVLFDRYNAQKVIYFDPDIVVYNRLDTLLDLLNSHLGILTPHILDPLDDDHNPNEVTFLRVGTYNLGFFALSRQGQWRRLLHWWQEKLYNDCIREVDKGLFVDQHWADLLPSLFDNIYVLREPGYNIAYWNFKTRTLTQDADGYHVNGKPLIFFHFSDFMVDNIEAVSKHQNRFTLDKLSSAYQTIFAEYRDRLLRHGYRETSHLPYAYSKFADGVPISDVLRVCLRQADIEGKIWHNPYDLTTPNNFRTWATSIDTQHQHLSPYVLTLFEMRREELKAVFADIHGADERNFARWFIQQESTSDIYNPVYTIAIKASLQDNVAPVSYSKPALKGHLGRTWHYYRAFKHDVEPYLAPNVMETESTLYTGPGGIYGYIRALLYRLGILQTIRRLIGIRLLMTIRYFFSPNSPSASAAIPTPGQAITLSSEGVNIVGYIRSETGVGQIARNLIRSLDAVGLPLATLPVETYDISRKQDTIADNYVKGTPYPINVFHVNADMTFPVRGILPDEIYNGHYNIGYWAWELAQFPDEWYSCFSIYSEIWVFSTFIRDAIAAVSPIPVTRVPVLIDPALSAPSSRHEFSLPDDAFVVLFMFDALSVIERKNPFGVIAAFEKAFTEEERRTGRVKLVMKINNLDRFPQQAHHLRTEMQRMNGLLFDTYFDRDQTNALLSHCDVYISLHRSEGYGLTIAEAMYFGKPVIATGYSGNMDFMNAENSFIVPCNLVPLEQDYPPYKAENYWAEPDIDTAAQLLRYVYENPNAAQRQGANAAQYIRQYHNAEVVGTTIAQRIHAIFEQNQLGVIQMTPPHRHESAVLDQSYRQLEAVRHKYTYHPLTKIPILGKFFKPIVWGWGSAYVWAEQALILQRLIESVVQTWMEIDETTTRVKRQTTEFTLPEREKMLLHLQQALDKLTVDMNLIQQAFRHKTDHLTSIIETTLPEVSATITDLQNTITSTKSNMDNLRHEIVVTNVNAANNQLNLSQGLEDVRANMTAELTRLDALLAQYDQLLHLNTSYVLMHQQMLQAPQSMNGWATDMVQLIKHLENDIQALGGNQKADVSVQGEKSDGVIEALSLYLGDRLQVVRPNIWYYIDFLGMASQTNPFENVEGKLAPNGKLVIISEPGTNLYRESNSSQLVPLIQEERTLANEHKVQIQVWELS